MEEAVGGHQVDLGVVGPAREELAQDAAGGALAHRDAAADADDVRHLGRQTAEEGRAGAVEILGASDVEIQEARHRQVDLRDLVQRHVLVDAAQPLQFAFGQRQRRVGTQTSPRLLVEGDVDRVGERVDLVVGQETPGLRIAGLDQPSVIHAPDDGRMDWFTADAERVTRVPPAQLRRRSRRPDPPAPRRGTSPRRRRRPRRSAGTWCPCRSARRRAPVRPWP